MVKIGTVTLPHIDTRSEKDGYIVAKKVIPGRILPILESVGGSGRTFEFTGEIWASDDINATKTLLRGLQIDPERTLDLEDDSDIMTCLVGDVSFDENVATPNRVPYRVSVEVKGLFQTGAIAESFGGFTEVLSYQVGATRGIAESFGGFTEVLTGELTEVPTILLGKDTLGNTTYPTVEIGNTAVSTSGGYADYQRYLKVTLPVPGTFTRLAIHAAANGHAKLALYSDKSGPYPDAKTIAEAAIAVTAAQWNWATIMRTYCVAADVWITANGDATDVVGYSAATGATAYDNSLAYASAFPDPAPGGMTPRVILWCLKAEYVKTKGYVLGTRYEAIASGNTVTIRVFFETGSAGNWRASLFTEGTDHPTTKIVESGSQAIVANSWNEITITSTGIINGTKYWPLIQVDDASALPHRVTGSAGDKSFYYAMAYGAFPADLTDQGTVESDTSANLWSIWA